MSKIKHVFIHIFIFFFRLKFGFKTGGQSTRRWWRPDLDQCHLQTCSPQVDRCPDLPGHPWCPLYLTPRIRHRGRCHPKDHPRDTLVLVNTVRASVEETRTTSNTINITHINSTINNNSNIIINTTMDFTDCPVVTTHLRPVRLVTCRHKPAITCHPPAARQCPSASGTAYISKTSSRPTWTRAPPTACSRSTRGTRPQITIWTRVFSLKLDRFLNRNVVCFPTETV